MISVAVAVGRRVGSSEGGTEEKQLIGRRSRRCGIVQEKESASLSGVANQSKVGEREAQDFWDADKERAGKGVGGASAAD